MQSAQPPVRLILGIDPGLQRTGYGFLQAGEAGIFSLVDAGCIRTLAHEPLAERLQHIFSGLNALLRERQPAEIAVEAIFYHRNVKTMVMLAYARACVLLAAAGFGIPTSEYEPLVVKKAVVGYGHATKSQVAFMVERMAPGMSRFMHADITDAVAVAICHAQTSRLNQQIERSR